MLTRSPSAIQLAHLSDPIVKELAALGQVRNFPRNTIIITEGDVSDSVYVILSGRVRVYVSNAEGTEMILDSHGPGEYIGEIAFDSQPRSASVITIEPTVCSIISRADFRQAIVRNPDIALQLIATLISRTRSATDNVKRLALLDVYGRVVQLLIKQAVEHEGQLVVREKLTQQDIASRVGASRDMVSRVLKDLVSGGYISIAQKIITIHRTPPTRW
jgi:CRP/FNR family cyclic AMP-dependent transcriptional regulator